MNLEITEIKELNLDRLDELVALEKETFGPSGLNEWVLPMIVRHGKVFALTVNGQLTGLAELIKDWKNHRVAFLAGFSIKPEKSGQGLGERFLAEIIERLKKENIKKIYLTVSPKNGAALSLYSNKFGFIEKEFSQDEYGKGQDRLLLALSLRD